MRDLPKGPRYKGSTVNIVRFIKAFFNGTLVDMRLPEIPVVGDPVRFKSYLSDIEVILDPGGRIDAQDPVYHKVDSSFFNPTTHARFIEWMQNQGLTAEYDPKFFDCDDFALCYWTWCRILYARQGLQMAASPFVGYCKSSAVNHVFNFAITENGLRFIEPQTGKVITNPGGIYWMQF